MASDLLSDVIDDFEAMCRSNAYSPATIRSYASTARRFLEHVGNIRFRNITARHVDTYFTARQVKGVQRSSLNAELTCLRALFKFASSHRLLPAGQNPLAHRRLFRYPKRHRQRVPAHDFPRLLDACDDPRNRAVVAVGLYLLLRQGEMKLIRVGDVDLTHGEVAVQIPKSGTEDRMPISLELDRELRRWLTAYTEELGRPPRPSDYLLPARGRFSVELFNADGTIQRGELRPHKPIGNPTLVVKNALEKCGYPTRDENGDPLGEGVHTLRRSAARARFDALVGQGYDGALRHVQSLLHHSASTTTETYLGIEVDRNRRDKLVKGAVMFPTDNSNVTSLEARRGSTASAN